MSESELLAHIYHRTAGAHAALGAGWTTLVGPGDDAAVLRGPGGDLLVQTVDQLVEGVHYEHGTDLDLVARKAVARSVSDLAAMGARPAWGTATGVLARGYTRGTELIDALHAWANHWHCPLVGGDLAFHAGSDDPLTLTVTLLGAMGEGHAPVLRSGAKPGDGVYLTGPVGDSFASGWHLNFEPRLDRGLLASEPGSGVHAMIDLSDGLGRDAARIGEASGVRLEIEAARVPLRTPERGWQRSFADGEDYELLMTGSTRDWPRRLNPQIVEIGRVRAVGPGETPGATVIDPQGNAHDATNEGWDHGR
ncbi:MAG: thiamine-monophosphate kinase [Phycisphaerales bacterium JB040]